MQTSVTKLLKDLLSGGNATTRASRESLLIPIDANTSLSNTRKQINTLFDRVGKGMAQLIGDSDKRSRAASTKKAGTNGSSIGLALGIGAAGVALAYQNSDKIRKYMGEMAESAVAWVSSTVKKGTGEAYGWMLRTTGNLGTMVRSGVAVIYSGAYRGMQAVSSIYDAAKDKIIKAVSSIVPSAKAGELDLKSRDAKMNPSLIARVQAAVVDFWQKAKGVVKDWLWSLFDGIIVKNNGGAGQGGSGGAGGGGSAGNNMQPLAAGPGIVPPPVQRQPYRQTPSIRRGTRVNPSERGSRPQPEARTPPVFNRPGMARNHIMQRGKQQGGSQGGQQEVPSTGGGQQGGGQGGQQGGSRGGRQEASSTGGGQQGGGRGGSRHRGKSSGEDSSAYPGGGSAGSGANSGLGDSSGDGGGGSSSGGGGDSGGGSTRDGGGGGGSSHAPSSSEGGHSSRPRHSSSDREAGAAQSGRSSPSSGSGSDGQQAPAESGSSSSSSPSQGDEAAVIPQQEVGQSSQGGGAGEESNIPLPPRRPESFSSGSREGASRKSTAEPAPTPSPSPRLDRDTSSGDTIRVDPKNSSSGSTSGGATPAPSTPKSETPVRATPGAGASVTTPQSHGSMVARSEAPAERSVMGRVWNELGVGSANAASIKGSVSYAPSSHTATPRASSPTTPHSAPTAASGTAVLRSTGRADIDAKISGMSGAERASYYGSEQMQRDVRDSYWDSKTQNSYDERSSRIAPVGNASTQNYAGRQQPIEHVPSRLGTEMGIDANQYHAYREGVAGIEDSYYGQKGGSSNRFSGRYQMGMGEVRAAARALGETPPTRQQYLNDPAMQERYFEQNTLSNHNSLMSRSEKYRDLPTDQKLAALGYAHNQGAGGASKWLRTGVESRDAFGTSGARFAGAVSDRLQNQGDHPSAFAREFGGSAHAAEVQRQDPPAISKFHGAGDRNSVKLQTAPGYHQPSGVTDPSAFHNSTASDATKASSEAAPDAGGTKGTAERHSSAESDTRSAGMAEAVSSPEAPVETAGRPVSSSDGASAPDKGATKDTASQHSNTDESEPRSGRRSFHHVNNDAGMMVVTGERYA